MQTKSTARARAKTTLEKRLAFLKLPIAERRRRMARQAERMLKHYKSPKETAQRQAWQGGDIVEPR